MLASVLAGAVEAAEAPLPEAGSSTIGYPNVPAAMAGLRSSPGVAFSMQNGWTIATDDAAATIWSFAPSGHAAYPSVVKRRLVEDGGATSMKMDVLCQAGKAACDDLVREFIELNEAARRSLAKGR